MKHTHSRTLLFATLACLAFGLAGMPFSGTSGPRLWASPATPRRTVFLARGLSDECLISLGSAVATQGDGAVLLLDSAKASPYLKSFLAAYEPDAVVPVGAFPDGVVELERRLAVRAAPVRTWTRGPPLDVWRRLFPRAEEVVVCPAAPRGRLLQAACLAGILRAPLFVTHDKDAEAKTLRSLMAGWRTRQVYLVGDARPGRTPRGVHPVRLADEAAVAAACRRRLAKLGRVQTLVVANPADTGKDMGSTSALAPWLATRKRAVLLLTDKTGKNVAAVVNAALRHETLRRADALILAGNLKSLPTLERPNPLPTDSEPRIEMEPLTPSGTEPFTFATGRIFHEDPAVVTLLLAREQLLARARGPRKALVASNVGGGLSLLETFSRNTALELRNVGYDTTALFGKGVDGAAVRKLLRGQDLFLWEGHHNTLIKDWDFPAWDEPLPPSFVFLQSCLALKEEKVLPVLSRGAVGVIGSSTRTFSGSGGACSLAFFDGLLYEHHSLGGALRHAKNFLLAYSLLKEKRLGKGAKRTGANLRSAWAFTLWGDPTLHLPRPQRPDTSLPHVRHAVVGNHIIVELPEESHPRVKTDKYQVQLVPGGRGAGLVKKAKKGEDERPLVPFVFAEVQLSRARPGMTPQLHSRMPSRHWVFCWDSRRRCGYLLVTPRAKDPRWLRFRVEWLDAEATKRVPETVGSGQ